MDKTLRDVFLGKVEEEPMARKLGMRLLDLEEGRARVEMDVTEDMTNIFGMFHGGAVFSLVDEAFQAACNAHGTVAIALNVSITYLAPARMGSRLSAEAREIHRTRRTANYEIRVTDDKGRLIASSQALAYRKGEPLPFLETTHR